MPKAKQTKTIPRPLNGYHNNFNTMMAAAGNGDLALVSAIRKADNKPVALVCAMRRNADGSVTPVPFAVMVEGNPFDLFEDPTVSCEAITAGAK